MGLHMASSTNTEARRTPLVLYAHELKSRLFAEPLSRFGRSPASITAAIHLADAVVAWWRDSRNEQANVISDQAV